MASWITARISNDLSSWLERYCAQLGMYRSEVVVDALERLRLEDPPELQRRGHWDLIHELRAELWRAEARVHELEVTLETPSGAAEEPIIAVRPRSPRHEPTAQTRRARDRRPAV
jgi:hypothetical protein